MSRNPLVQVTFALQNTPETELRLPGLESERLPLHNGTAKFDLSLSLTEIRGELHGLLEYSTDLFERSTIERMVGHLQTLLEGIVENPKCCLSELPLLTAAEREQLLVEWNATAVLYPKNKCIHELFEEQVAQNPEAVAVVDDQHTLSYGDLNARANQLAHYLRGLGVGTDVLVGLCMQRSVDMVVAILGILKSGGAYVPLEPSYPSQRLAFMLEDTQAPVLLTEAALREQLPPFQGRVICVDRDWARIAQEPKTNPSPLTTAHSLAYVMYTSGSTGVPKGVAVPHRGVVRLVRGANYVDFGPEHTHMLLAPISFDASTFELWGALLNGAKCVVFAERVPSSQSLGRALREHGITTLWLTAALFNTVVDEAPDILAGLKQLLTGGEALSVPHVRRALARLPETALINGYGPTESTTFTCCYRIPRPLPESLTSVPIGRPISNTQVYVLDADRNPVPIGVPGELYIGGDGLARGYINQSGLTEERFVANPFIGDADARLYRTGDRVRYLADGNIEFLGRLDDQVKIRGFRIEPGEIQATLLQHPAVNEAVVVARSDDNGCKLAAYVVPRSTNPPAPMDLLAFLRLRLPDYMVPSACVPPGAAAAQSQWQGGSPGLTGSGRTSCQRCQSRGRAAQCHRGPADAHLGATARDLADQCGGQLL
jgi:aspartate racemase